METPKNQKFRSIAEIIKDNPNFGKSNLRNGEVSQKDSTRPWPEKDVNTLSNLLKKYTAAAIRKKAWRILNKDWKEAENSKLK